MAALCGLQLLAHQTPADIHQRYGIQGVPSKPWGNGAMRRLAVEYEFHGNIGILAYSIARGKISSHMGMENSIDPVEISVAW